MRTISVWIVLALVVELSWGTPALEKVADEVKDVGEEVPEVPSVPGSEKTTPAPEEGETPGPAQGHSSPPPPPPAQGHGAETQKQAPTPPDKPSTASGPLPNATTPVGKSTTVKQDSSESSKSSSEEEG